MYIHTYMHTYIHTHIHTYTYTYIHTKRERERDRERDRAREHKGVKNEENYYFYIYEVITWGKKKLCYSVVGCED